MVHHDDALGRLTVGSGALINMTAAELKAVEFRDTPERMMSLAELCALVNGRVPLVIEVKSHFDGDRQLVKRMAEVLAAYSGRRPGCPLTRIRWWRYGKSCPSYREASLRNGTTMSPPGKD